MLVSEAARCPAAPKPVPAPIYGNGSKLTGVLTTLSGHNVSELTNDAGYVTGAYSPANPGQWVTPPPATVAEALDRLAALASNAGANPIP